ncbi:MAG TPA: aldo/keto reductase [Acidimicrobiales bacterium]|nr:aldo/keto reductase [Acidimicrobiales bacterium]
MNTVPKVTLNNGVEIPQLGFGVFKVDPTATVRIVTEAIEVGYRHIDTAEMYGNEAEVGEAIRRSGLGRDAFFVTSKLNNNFRTFDAARSAFDGTLAALDIGQIDLFLIHWPLSTVRDFVVVWKALERAYAEGRARSIGVSNFTIDHLSRLFDESDVVPAVNQVEVHPYFAQNDLLAFHTAHHLATEAWAPLAQGAILGDPRIAKIAEAHGRSVAQVTLRWHVQRGSIVFPKSSNPARMRENFAIFDFELAPDEMDTISGLDRHGRVGSDPATFDDVAR